MTKARAETFRATLLMAALAVLSFVLPHTGASAAIINVPVNPAETDSTGDGQGQGQTDKSSIRLRTSSQDVDRKPLLEAAVQGNIDAMLELGYFNFRADSSPQSLGLARRWFKMASDARDPRGMLAYGYMLSQGQGGEKNVAQAKTILAQSADQGIARATYILSQIESASPARKRDAAKKLLIQASEAGDSVALNTLATQQELEGDTDKAKINYMLAAQLGNRTAKVNLDRLNNSSRRVQRASVQEAKEKAADKDAEAMLALAHRYHRGDGVTKDFNKAFNLFQEAAKRGSSAASEMVQLILLKPSSDPSLPFDPAWMQALSSRALVLTGENRDNSSYLPVRNPDPLWGLLLPPGTPGSVLPAVDESGKTAKRP